MELHSSCAQRNSFSSSQHKSIVEYICTSSAERLWGFSLTHQSVKCWIRKKIKQACNKTSLNYLIFSPPLESITHSRETSIAGFPYFCLFVLCNMSVLPGISAWQEYKEKWQCISSKVEITSVCIKIQAFFTCNFMHLGHWKVPTANSNTRYQLAYRFSLLKPLWIMVWPVHFCTSTSCNCNCNHLGGLNPNIKRLSCGFFPRWDKARWFPKKEF